MSVPVHYRCRVIDTSYSVELVSGDPTPRHLGKIFARIACAPECPSLVIRSFEVPDSSFHDRAVEILFRLSQEAGCGGRLLRDDYNGIVMNTSYSFQCHKHSALWPDLTLSKEHPEFGEALGLAIDLRQSMVGNRAGAYGLEAGKKLQTTYPLWCHRLQSHAAKALGRQVDTLLDAIIWGLYCRKENGRLTEHPFQGSRYYLAQAEFRKLNDKIHAPPVYFSPMFTTLNDRTSGFTLSYNNDDSFVRVIDASTASPVGQITYRTTPTSLEIVSLEMQDGLPGTMMPAMIEAAYRTSHLIGKNGCITLNPPEGTRKLYSSLGFAPVLHSDLREDKVAYGLAQTYLLNPTVENGKRLVDLHRPWVEAAQAHAGGTTYNLSEILSKGMFSSHLHLSPETQERLEGRTVLPRTFKGQTYSYRFERNTVDVRNSETKEEIGRCELAVDGEYVTLKNLQFPLFDKRSAAAVIEAAYLASFTLISDGKISIIPRDSLQASTLKQIGFKPAPAALYPDLVGHDEALALAYDLKSEYTEEGAEKLKTTYFEFYTLAKEHAKKRSTRFFMEDVEVKDVLKWGLMGVLDPHLYLEPRVLKLRPPRFYPQPRDLFA